MIEEASLPEGLAVAGLSPPSRKTALQQLHGMGQSLIPWADDQVNVIGHHAEDMNPADSLVLKSDNLIDNLLTSLRRAEEGAPWFDTDSHLERVVGIRIVNPRTTTIASVVALIHISSPSL